MALQERSLSNMRSGPTKEDSGDTAVLLEMLTREQMRVQAVVNKGQSAAQPQPNAIADPLLHALIND